MTSKNHIIYPGKRPTTAKITFENHDEHLYYFILKDCKKLFVTPKITNISIPSILGLETKLTVINAGSHLGS